MTRSRASVRPDAATAVQSAPLWHLLQISDVLDLEFGTALAESIPVIGWEPQRMLLPFRIPPGNEPEHRAPNSSLRVRRLPLLRGFARLPVSGVTDVGPRIVERLLQQTDSPQSSTLLCTVPFFATVAERWPGPVVYWLTDLIAEYASANRRQVEFLDRRMCQAATLVCPNSPRLKEYLVTCADCDPTKVQIIPNATRACNLLLEPPDRPMDPPVALADVPRPMAGIIGNLAGNMDWLLLQQLVERTPWLSWVFVGPISMGIPDSHERRAREALIRAPTTHFVGRQPFGSLASYARAFDFAVLPYKRCEPTYSGSSTRFYEHLAACRPMIATRGFEELTRKEPLLRLIDTAEQALRAIEELRSINFDDGLLRLRWEASKQCTWQARAGAVQAALVQQSGVPS